MLYHWWSGRHLAFYFTSSICMTITIHPKSQNPLLLIRRAAIVCGALTDLISAVLHHPPSTCTHHGHDVIAQNALSEAYLTVAEVV